MIGTLRQPDSWLSVAIVLFYLRLSLHHLTASNGPRSLSPSLCSLVSIISLLQTSAWLLLTTGCCIPSYYLSLGLITSLCFSVIGFEEVFLKKVLNSFDCEYVPPLPSSNQLLIGQVINEQCSFSLSIHMFFAPEHTILFPIWTINAAIYWG